MGYTTGYATNLAGTTAVAEIKEVRTVRATDEEGFEARNEKQR
jgi:hypothetical protein